MQKIQFSRVIPAILSSVFMLGYTDSANAHDDHYLDSVKSVHNGQTRMAGAYHLELLLNKDSKTAKENPVTVYVTDHAGTAISSKGASASMTIVQGSSKSTVTLSPEGENLLVGKANYASTANLKIVLTVTLAGKAAELVRFTPFAPVKAVSAPAVEHQHQH